MLCQPLFTFYILSNCSYYWGATPHFLITDLDMVKDIMVKYSEIFMDRLVSCIYYQSLIVML